MFATPSSGQAWLLPGHYHLAGLSSWGEIDSPDLKDVVEGGTRNIPRPLMILRHTVSFCSCDGG
jgi:hypothetical protein